MRQRRLGGAPNIAATYCLILTVLLESFNKCEYSIKSIREEEGFVSNAPAPGVKNIVNLVAYLHVVIYSRTKYNESNSNQQRQLTEDNSDSTVGAILHPICVLH